MKLKKCSVSLPVPQMIRLVKNYVRHSWDVIEGINGNIDMPIRVNGHTTRIIKIYPLSILRFKKMCKNCKHLKYNSNDRVYGCELNNKDFEVIHSLPFQLDSRRFLNGDPFLPVLARQYEAKSEVLLKLEREAQEVSKVSARLDWQAFISPYIHLWRKSKACCKSSVSLAVQDTKGAVVSCGNSQEKHDKTSKKVSAFHFEALKV